MTNRKSFDALCALASTEPPPPIDVKNATMRAVRGLPRLRPPTRTERFFDAIALAVEDWLLNDSIDELGVPGATILAGGLPVSDLYLSGGE